MAVKLKTPLILLTCFCLVLAIYSYYIYKIDDPLSGIHCESSLYLNHNLKNSDGSNERIEMKGSMNFAFIGHHQGILVMTGVIIDGESSQRFKKSFDFNFVSQPLFYKFSFDQNASEINDRKLSALFNVLFTNNGSYLEIRKLDNKNLIIGNMSSPTQICNITP